MAQDDGDKEPPQTAKGTEYGFAGLSVEGTERPRAEPSRASLPPPKGGASRARPAPTPEPTEAAPQVLRRVDHELAQPARLGVGETHAGRELMREQITGGAPLEAVPSEELIRQDLLAPEQLPVWQRVITAVTWTRGRLIATVVALPLLLVGVIALVVHLTAGPGEPRPPQTAHRASATEQQPPRAAPANADPGGADPSNGAAKAPPADAPAAGKGAALEEARAQLKRGFCPDAARALTKLVKSEPQNPTAQLLLGHAQVCQGQHQAGLRAYDAALAADRALGADKRLLEDLSFLLADKKQRGLAIKVAAKVGEPATEQLLGAATSDDREVRRAAVAALATLGAAKKVDWRTCLWLDLQQSPCAERGPVIEQIIARVPPKQARKLLGGALRDPKQACARGPLKAAIKRLK